MNNQNDQLAGRKRRKVEVKAYDIEVIIQILKTMMKCGSGVDTHLFSYGPFDNDDNRSFNCHLCWVTNLFGLNDVRTHLKSERHCKNLKRIPALTQFKLPLAVSFKKIEGRELKYFKIFAGENIEKPDPQIEQCFLSEFQWFLTNVDETIVKILSEDPMNDRSKLKTIFGVNFLGKMASATGQLRYFCFLCEENLKIEENEPHFTSTDHEYKYIKEFFPLSLAKVLDSFNFLQDDSQRRTAICDFFRNIYHELVSEHGFQSVTIVNENDLNNNFIRLQSKIWSLEHYGESYSDFSTKRVAAYVQKLLEAPKLYKEIKPPAKFIGDMSFLHKEENSPESKPPPAKRVHTEDIKSFIANYELQKFKDKEVEAIKTRFKACENDPKSFRLYSEEWNRFYQARRAELQKKGTNLNTYDFQKDFKDNWKKRCEELMNIAIKEKLAEIDSGTCRPPPKPENVNLPAVSVNPTQINAGRSVVVNKQSTPRIPVAPPPPLWKHKNQEVVNVPKPTLPVVVPKLTPIGNIPQLLLAIETFNASLGPEILQLINQANIFKQGNDPNKIGTYVVLCRRVEATLAGHLADRTKLQIFKNAVKNLNELVNPDSFNGSTIPLPEMRTTQVQNPPIQRGPEISMNTNNGTYDSGNSSQKPAITSLRQTTNPMFDFERKTYGELQLKEENNDTNDLNEDLSYRSERQNLSRNMSPVSNYSFKSDYGERNDSNQVARQYMDGNRNISSQDNRSNMGNDSFGGRNTSSFANISSFGNQNRHIGNLSNNWSSPSNRQNF